MWKGYKLTAQANNIWEIIQKHKQLNKCKLKKYQDSILHAKILVKNKKTQCLKWML